MWVFNFFQKFCHFLFLNLVFNESWLKLCITVKSVIFILKIYTNYKLPMFRTNFLKLKFWKSLSNSQSTFNLENLNLLSNSNVNPQNGVVCKEKTCIYLQQKLTNQFDFWHVYIDSRNVEYVFYNFSFVLVRSISPMLCILYIFRKNWRISLIFGMYI